jgi:hypothetical protein
MTTTIRSNYELGILNYELKKKQILEGKTLLTLLKACRLSKGLKHKRQSIEELL